MMTNDSDSQEPVDYKNAQADAKAAAARAKALRPWYKKKRFIIGIPVAIIVILAAVGGNSTSPTGESSSSALTSASAPTVSSAGSSGVVQGKIGQLIRVGDLDLTIEGVESVNTKTFNQFNEANVRVKVTATNARGRADRTYDILITSFKLVDGGGIAHSQSFGCAGCPNEISNVSLTKDGSVTGYVYYALPAGTSMKEVRYEPLFSTNKAFISLGQ